MNYFVTSLDDPKKRLNIIWVGGSAMGDIVIGTNFMAGAYLLSWAGSGNSSYDCPVFEAAMKVVTLFNQSKQHLLETKPLTDHAIDFSFEPADIITFATPDDAVESEGVRLDFIRSKEGFFGINTRANYDPSSEIIDPTTVAWVSGPPRDDYAAMFGKNPYARRTKLFGELYQLAAAVPSKMANPIYPTPEGKKFIHRGDRQIIVPSEPL